MVQSTAYDCTTETKHIFDEEIHHSWDQSRRTLYSHLVKKGFVIQSPTFIRSYVRSARLFISPDVKITTYVIEKDPCVNIFSEKLPLMSHSHTTAGS